MTTHQFAPRSAVALILITSVLVASVSAPIPLSGDDELPLIISLVAGTGDTGFSGDGGPATEAKLSGPTTVAVDGAGRVYIADEDNHRIRMVDTDGVITTFAGYGDSGGGGDGVLATAAQLQYPSGVAVDTSGNVFIADRIDHRVRMVPAADGTYFTQEMQAGCIYTIAGTGTLGWDGDGVLGTTTRLDKPWGVAVDSSGNVYIGDGGNCRVRRVAASTGFITTVAGAGPGSYTEDREAVTQYLPTVYDVDITPDGHLLIALVGINVVAMVPSTSGTLYGRSMTAGYIYTLAGMMNQPGFEGDGGPANSAKLRAPTGMAADADGNVYIADTSNHRVRVVGADGIITTYAGTGDNESSGDGGPPLEAGLMSPWGVGTGAGSRVHIADNTANRVREVGPDVETVELALAVGWNMVSVPVRAADMSRQVIFPPDDVVAVYTWDPLLKRYVVPNTIVPEVGYWVAVTSDKPIYVTGTPVTTWPSSLITGWNMVGSVYGPAVSVNDEDAFTVAPPGSVLTSAIYQWNPVGKTYNAATSIEQGVGYWLASVADCELTLGPPD